MRVLCAPGYAGQSLCLRVNEKDCVVMFHADGWAEVEDDVGQALLAIGTAFRVAPHGARNTPPGPPPLPSLEPDEPAAPTASARRSRR